MEGTPKAGEGAGKARSWGVTSLVIQHSSLTLLVRSDSNTRGIAKGMEGKHYSRWKTSPTRVKNEKKRTLLKRFMECRHTKILLLPNIEFSPLLT